MRIKMPAVRIAQADADVPGQHQDILTCGVCQKPFALGDIVKFIQHKVLACNKENYSCIEGTVIDSADSDDGGGGLSVPLGVVNARRPSISAPIKKSSSTGPRILCTTPPLGDEPRCSTPIKPDPSPEGLCLEKDISTPRIKQELDSTTSSPDETACKKMRTEVVDAESNTTHSEPSNYVCSTCKQRLHSAWRLVQHVQHSHGIKIYIDTSPTTSMMGSSPGASKAPHHLSSSSSSCSGSSTCSTGSSGNANGGPTNPSIPLPPPGVSSRLGHHPATSSPLVDPHLPLHHPFGVGGLLRMPMGEPPRHHQFPPISVSTALSSHLTHHSTSAPLFARPSSHDHHFRMEQLVTEQFRLNQHHSLGLAAAAAAVAAAGGVPPPHSPFPPSADRPAPGLPTSSTPRTAVPPPPSLALSLEPQLDFYSQRLRQLAGTTSPGAANGNSSPSPRKLTPPFTSPNNNPPLPSIPTNSIHSNNNNNNVANNNNNVTPTSTYRPQSATPPEKQSQMAETPANDSGDLTSTPRSASSPPPTNKPADFSLNSGSMSAVTENVSRACEFCGKKFRFQSNLIVHRRTHTGEKPYKCSVCNHACTQSSKLKRHMKIHRNSNRGSGGAVEGEEGDATTNGNAESTADQASNVGSIESLDDDCDDDDDDELDEEEDEEEEEEDMEIEEEEGDEDDDLGGDAPEDLTTKSTASTPPNSSEPNNKTASTPRPTPTATPLEKVVTPGSLVGELMDKFGLSNIQQYSEAYKQALQESVGSQQFHMIKDEYLQRSPIISDNNNGGSKPHPPSIRHLENGIMDKSAAALRFREEFAKNMITGQPPLDLVGGPHGLFGPGAPFEIPFDASNKRLKLDLESHHASLGRGPDRDGLYPGLWFPAAMAAAHHRGDLFGGNDQQLDFPRSKSNPENALLKNGPRPGPSASSLAVALNLGLPGQHVKKENRRNDTCEYCGKVFKNCSNLTVHRRSHTGEKPYKCELCSYACAQSSKLTRHMKTHGRLGKDVYRCRFCEMPFSVPSTLEKHMRKCVVNQNNKSGGHILPSIMCGEDDSSGASVPKDST